jgi:hypothetical protein
MLTTSFANVGMAHEGPDGLLGLNLPLDLELPSRLLGISQGGPSRLLGVTHGSPLDGATDGLMSSSSPTGLDLGLLDGMPVKELLGNPDVINSVGSPQSAIWTFDPASRRLFARYVNSNGGESWHIGG